MYAAVFPHCAATHASAALPAVEVPAGADSRLGDFSNRVCHADSRLGDFSNRVCHADSRLGDFSNRVCPADSRLGDFSNRVCPAMTISARLKTILTRRDGYLNGAENVLDLA